MTPEELELQRQAQEAADTLAAATASAATAAANAATPTTIDGQTPDQIRASLARLAEFETAETARAAEAEAARQQNLSDIDRERVARETAEGERETARQSLEAETRAANNLRLALAAQNSARELGLNLHPTALNDALQLGDFANVTFNDAREPQDVTEALKALVARKPYLVATTGAPNLSGNDSGRDQGTLPDDAATRRASRSLIAGF